MTTQIFVFGSNLAGRHGKGAALHAKRYKGAIYGQGVGRQGESYAIPTKDRNLRPLALAAIEYEVRVFLEYAQEHPDDVFEVTAIGCGLAGRTPKQIAPMFRHAPNNVLLPVVFREVLDD